MKKLIFLFVLIFSCGIVNAQYKSFNLGLEIRPRLLLDNGYKTPKSIDEKTYSFITQRTRINAEYEKNILQAYVSIQDIRFWGDDNKFKENGVFGNTESLSLHQAWFALKPNKTISIKIGRQLFKYDDQRIISSRNWNDYQITYDAVLIKFEKDKNNLDIGITYNTESTNNDIFPNSKFKIFDFIRYQQQINNLKVSAVTLLTGNTINDSSDQVYLRGTYGLNANYILHDLKIRSSFYFQNNLNNNGENVRAFCFSIFAKKDIILQKLNAGFGFDYLSGNDETKTSDDYIITNHSFDILYGRRHGWYGFMDYFSTTPEQGLCDFMFKLEYLFNKKINLQADFHQFYLAENKFDLQDGSSKLNKNLGQEFDFTLKWKIIDEASLQAGYSFYLMTNSLKQVIEVNNEKLKLPQFVYLMISIKPFLF